MILGILGRQIQEVLIAGQVSKDAIDFFTQQIRSIERVVEAKVKLRPSYQVLLTTPGIGKILALTIMLEVGDINRFAGVGNFASYARTVASKRLSAGKGKGSGNRKNGNRYLSWAFIEAANFARRFNTGCRSYYEKKAAQRNTIVATKALSNKLARSCYYIIKDQVPFRQELFSH